MKGVWFRSSRIAIFVLVALLPSMGPVAGSPSADLWPHWATYDQNSTLVADHSVWTRFLETYVHADEAGATWVDYGAVSAPDHAMIDVYIGFLERFPVRQATRDQQLAYWINLYNVLTVRLVLAHYPIASIRDIDISPGWFSDGPWGAKVTTVDGRKLSLNDIEHRILRPIWQDPRIHYVVNCASIGCPGLAPRAYTASDIEAQLAAAARTFVSHPRAISVIGGRVHASSLYKWYRADFGDTESGVLDHIQLNAAGPLAGALVGMDRIDAYDYDWSLNDLRAKFRVEN
jgi:hypothetical protein